MKGKKNGEEKEEGEADPGPEEEVQRVRQARAQPEELSARMSEFIGCVKGPKHEEVADVHCGPGTVSLRVVGVYPTGVTRSFDPIAARNLAALLVRGSEEQEQEDRTPVGSGG